MRRGRKEQKKRREEESRTEWKRGKRKIDRLGKEERKKRRV